MQSTWQALHALLWCGPGRGFWPSAEAKLCVLGTPGLLLAAGVGCWVIVQGNCMTRCYTHHWDIRFFDREQTSIS